MMINFRVVFIVNLLGGLVCKINFEIEAASESKTIGPFLNKNKLIMREDEFSDADRSFLSYIKRAGGSNGEISSEIIISPYFHKFITSHNHVYLRSKKNGSIRKATTDQLGKWFPLTHIDENIPLAKLHGGEFYLLGGEHFNVRMFWRYQGISQLVPLELSEFPVIGNDGLKYLRDFASEEKLISDGLPSEIQYALLNHKELTDNQVLMLLDLPSEQWSVFHEKQKVISRSSRHITSAIKWFDDNSDEQGGGADIENIITAYLEGRKFTQLQGLKIFVPSIIDAKNRFDIFTRAFGGESIYRQIKLFQEIYEKQLQNKDNINNELKNKGFLGMLRPFQINGVAWMLALQECGLGGLLADEMGLGKTIQTIAFLTLTIEQRNAPNLLLAPASVVPNWENEILRFSPQLKIYKELPIPNTSSRAILIMSYQKFFRQADSIKKISYSSIILDEAQIVKNAQSKTSQLIGFLHGDFRLILTGTPIENNVDEIWNHLNFLNAWTVPLIKKIKRRFPNFSRSIEAAEYTGKMFSPLIMRRVKEEVANHLPPITVKDVLCKMESDQYKLYNKTLMIFKKILNSPVGARNTSMALEAILRLRQCCSAPEILPPSLNPDAIRKSIKIDTTISIINDSICNNRKIIVFSQFTGVLNALEKVILNLGVRVARLDGHTINRSLPVDEFQNDPNVKVFLIAFKAGGFGINLTAAERVVLFDPWWNPAAEDQAFSRAHRIGQTRPVLVNRLICSGTIEEKMNQIRDEKIKLYTELYSGSSKFTFNELKSIIFDWS